MGEQDLILIRKLVKLLCDRGRAAFSLRHDEEEIIVVHSSGAFFPFGFCFLKALVMHKIKLDVADPSDWV